MARAKVQDKYRAILDAAISVFAEQGFWDTPTSLISKTAGVADGTLFNYFKTKDDLIQEVYLDIKKELARVLLEDLPAEASYRDKLHHVWNQNIAWGVAHPDRFKVLQQISSSYKVSDEIATQANEPFLEIEKMMDDCIASGVFGNYPVEYLRELVDTQTTIAIRFASQQPEKLADYQQMGFDILWNGVTR